MGRSQESEVRSQRNARAQEPGGAPAPRLSPLASRHGFTLVEMLVVIAIIGVLATIVIARYAGQTDQAKAAAAKAHLSQFESAIVSFHSQVGRLPRALSELVEKPANAANWPEGGYLKGKAVPKDPWGNEYVYKVSGRRFEVISLGADGKEGGEGPDQDLSSEGASTK